ncbi:MAG TPA: PHB depolymerase family esterase [Polyangia bacterium]|nr:PHB depolymerase family esterase [Polyangia bacterium]
MTRWAVAAGTLAMSASAVADPEVHVLPVRDLAPGERRPLLVFLHGLGGSGSEALADPNLRAMAERGRMVLVAPDGTYDRAGRRFWNAGPACCNLDRKPVDDVARIQALISSWLSRPEIDRSRAYVVGFSNGGFMAHRLACGMADQLAAVVSIAGAGRSPEEACAPAGPIAVLDVHGDADPIVRYQGGRVFDDPSLAPHPPAPVTFQAWARRLGCPLAAGPKVTTVDLDPRLPGAETRVESFSGCPRGAAELWTVHGGEHDVETPALMERVGAFLAAHPKAARPKK